MNTEPLRNYIKGIEEFKAGNADKALELISNAVGANKPTSYMRSSLPELASPNDAILTLILYESQRGT